MKKICFFISSISNTGGTERVCSEISNKLSTLGYRVTILSMYGSTPYFKLDTSIQILSVFPVRRRFKVQVPILPGKLRSRLRRISPDMLINVDSALFLLSSVAGAGLGFKNVVWEHFNFNFSISVIRKLSRKLAARYSSAIVVLTQADYTVWKKSSSCRAPVVIINNPSPFTVVDEINERQHIVLSIGRLTYQKGFDRLLDAWAILKSKDSSDWQLHIVGSGELKDALDKQIKHYKLSSSVHLFPATQQIENHYRDAAIYCLSSRFEGFPMVLLEAQSYGLPIVSFNCQTGPEEIVVNGSGILVKDGDAEALAEELLHLTSNENKRIEMSEKSLENAGQYTIEKIIREWVWLLDTQLT
jgi:glycosyltransferase involved in cell wall biosynthesis